MQPLLTKNFPLIKRYTFNVNNSTLTNVICCLNCINICNRIWNFFSSISRVDAEFIQKFISWWIVYMKTNWFTIIILKYNFDVQSCFTQLQFIYYVTHYTFDCLLFFINYHRITAFKTKLLFFPWVWVIAVFRYFITEISKQVRFIYWNVYVRMFSPQDNQDAAWCIHYGTFIFLTRFILYNNFIHSCDVNNLTLDSKSFVLSNFVLSKFCYAS